ncbi:hypothetical protein [Phaffia rhodozyma]|uniref:Uncharacterized protein n=1 Tax=Phaffia rhodozyma TaxID=264483 RepID=A0A0F7SSW3_PHARH|nr:hypothetical protein [Phaffia rhodozyma]
MFFLCFSIVRNLVLMFLSMSVLVVRPSSNIPDFSTTLIVLFSSLHLSFSSSFCLVFMCRTLLYSSDYPQYPVRFRTPNLQLCSNHLSSVIPSVPIQPIYKLICSFVCSIFELSLETNNVMLS